MRKRLIFLSVIALALISCTTTSFVPYRGNQEAWEYGAGAFRTEFKGIIFFESMPDRPYEIVGYVDVPVYGGLNCPPESAESCWRRVVARNARERSCEAVIVVSEWVTSERHTATVMPGFFGPMVFGNTQQQKTRRAILIRFIAGAQIKKQASAPPPSAPSISPKPAPIPVEAPKATSPDAPYDFRKATWGMSKMEVESTEIGQRLNQDENNVVYGYELYGLDCTIIYSFENDRLLRGTILIAEIHNDVNQYLSDFNAIKSIMTAKYGKPAQDDTLWRNEQYKEIISKWGEAMQQGHLVLFAKWFYLNTTIHLQISGEGGKIKLAIQYRKP